MTDRLSDRRLTRRRVLQLGATVLAGALCAPVAALSTAAPRIVRRRTLWAMGGWHFVEVETGTSSEADQALRAAVRAIREIDQTFTVFDQRSPLAQLNISRATTIRIDNELLGEGIRDALRWAERTEGAFDPTVEPLMHRWGFRQPAGCQGGSLEVGNDNATLWNYGAVEWDEEHGILRRASPLVRLDSGGWAKGWAAERAVDAALCAGADCAQVNCGGDIVRRGVRANPWTCSIRDPEGDRTDTAFRVRHAFPAVATSANTESYRTDADDRRWGHLIDPRKGKPAVSDLASVTVFAEHGLDADALASGLFVMGRSGARTWLREHSEFAAVLIGTREAGAPLAPTVDVVGPLEVERVSR